jgi:hypothetical protein
MYFYAIILEHVIGSDLDSSGLCAKCQELTLLRHIQCSILTQCHSA